MTEDEAHERHRLVHSRTAAQESPSALWTLARRRKRSGNAMDWRAPRQRPPGARLGEGGLRPPAGGPCPCQDRLLLEPGPDPPPCFPAGRTMGPGSGPLRGWCPGTVEATKKEPQLSHEALRPQRCPASPREGSGGAPAARRSGAADFASSPRQIRTCGTQPAREISR